MAGNPPGNPYERDLDKRPANFVPLTPLTLIERAAAIFPGCPAIVHGNRRQSWAETYARCRRLASALARRGIGAGDTVAVMAPNVPELYEAHFGVPMAGAVLNALNVRLDAGTIAFILEHGEAKALITDREFAPTVKAALARLGRKPLVIDIDDPLAQGGELLGTCDYEAFIATGDPD
jgi:fatty-acyl-CoA synthase